MDKIKQIKQWLNDADAVLIGAGAGLSAAGGLNYADPTLVDKWFPEYKELGLEQIPYLLSTFWDVSDENACAYYAYWVRHIFHVRYEPQALAPYTKLYDLVAPKDHFVITTNVDNQFYKADFNKNSIYAMQGNYGQWQCSKPCREDAIFDNASDVLSIMEQVKDLKIPAESIPRCPYCNSYLIPHLRKDNSFLEGDNSTWEEKYIRFVNDKLQKGEKLVLLELGIGFNTPVIIRHPFDFLAQKYPDTVKLVRINLENAQVPEVENAIGIEMDINTILNNLSIN